LYLIKPLILADEGGVGTSASSSDKDYLIVVWVFVGLFIGVLIVALIIYSYRRYKIKKEMIM